MEQQKIAPGFNPDEQNLAQLRSAFLDEFATLEAAVFRILKSCGDTPGGEPFSQRVKSFRKADKTNLIAKLNLGQRDQIADAICALLPLRADIVHSAMTLRNIDGQNIAIFINVNDACSDYPWCRLLSDPDFRELIYKIKMLCNRIAGLGRITPPSSPPPPSPGAAAGP